MEMWLRVSTLVFLTVAWAGLGLSAQMIVFLGDPQKNSQGRVTVPSGSSLTLNCSVNTLNSEKFWIEWKFKPLNSSANHHENLSKCIHEEIKQKLCQGRNRTLTLWNVNETHSGWYYCEVTKEIPKLETMISRYEEVYVSKNAKESTTYPSLLTSKQVTPPNSGVPNDWWIWVVVGVSSLILIVLLILVICVARKRGCPTRTEERIYANTHRRPSPRPGQDNLKTVSSTTSRPARRYYEEKCSHIQRGAH